MDWVVPTALVKVIFTQPMDLFWKHPHNTHPDIRDYLLAIEASLSTVQMTKKCTITEEM